MQNNLYVYCDGGARGNPGPGASAFVVYDNQNKLVYENGVKIGNVTNNQAEYQAIINALDWLNTNVENCGVTFYLDSLLIVNQLKRLYKVKDPILKQKFQQVLALLQKAGYKIIDYVYIPREQNSRADFLVNLALDKPHQSLT
jgi:ribonuclease HI